jgi:flavin reductase (DIM6/NTAB) family NADH-FMN oxidoreductase RutF
MYVEGADFTSIDFRRGVWHQTTTAVALLTAAAEGRENVMACEWAMMVSTAPLCFVISVHPSHETHDLIARSGEFGLSFCGDDQARLSHVSGSYSLLDVDKWSLADFPRYRGQVIAAPLIDGSPLNVECRVVGRHDLGHTVFIGEAVWARYDEGGRAPLLYHDAKYWHLGSQVPKS